MRFSLPDRMYSKNWCVFMFLLLVWITSCRNICINSIRWAIVCTISYGIFLLFTWAYELMHSFIYTQCTLCAILSIFYKILKIRYNFQFIHELSVGFENNFHICTLNFMNTASLSTSKILLLFYIKSYFIYRAMYKRVLGYFTLIRT